MDVAQIRGAGMKRKSTSDELRDLKRQKLANEKGTKQFWTLVDGFIVGIDVGHRACEKHKPRPYHEDLFFVKPQSMTDSDSGKDCDGCLAPDSNMRIALVRSNKGRVFCSRIRWDSQWGIQADHEHLRLNCVCKECHSRIQVHFYIRKSQMALDCNRKVERRHGRQPGGSDGLH